MKKKRAKSAWTITPDGDSITIDCNFKPLCPHCKNDGILNYLKLFMVQFLNFSIELGSKKNNSYALDIELRCPACGFYDIYGVPVNKECYEKGLEVVKNNEVPTT